MLLVVNEASCHGQRTTDNGHFFELPLTGTEVKPRTVRSTNNKDPFLLALVKD